MKVGTLVNGPNSAGNRRTASADGRASVIASMTNPAAENSPITSASGRRQKCWVTSTSAFA